ncbi:MAG: putative phosphatase [Proteobacteria bacterium]|nr:putative phosphatase [Pseudomonadota bacterium]
MKITLLAAAIGAAFSMTAQAEGPMAFNPIAGSAYGLENDPSVSTEPYVIPEGYEQRIVADEDSLNIYSANDWPDMNTVNESGKQSGRFLYRTHEVRPGTDARADGGLGGAVSVVDLKTGKTKEVVTRTDWEALDGLVWTPWNTLLFAEETITAARPDPKAPQATSGMLYELKLKNGDLTAAHSVNVRPLLGSLSHEGIEVDGEGNVYVIDEDRGGSIYKFVPETYGDLSKGQLYALKVEAGAKTGKAEWVALDMNQVQVSARVAAKAVQATPFCRPEDLEIIGRSLFAALTCEDVDNAANINGPGAVLAIKLGKRPSVKYLVAPGKNVSFETKPSTGVAGVTGFKSPDNLAKSADGKLWIVEDNDWSDIWVVDPKGEDANDDGYPDEVSLFASLKDQKAEGTGIYFGKDTHTLFVNVQHSGTGNDKTIAISRSRQDD